MDLRSSTPEECRIAAENNHAGQHPELEAYRIGHLRGVAICGRCGQPEPVDRNGEFLGPCPNRRKD